jgi:hypothetical protein
VVKIKNIVYCVVGKESLIPQVICSMNSVYETIGECGFRFILVSNLKKALIRQLEKYCKLFFHRIVIEEISQNEIEKWIGDTGYIYRIKIIALEYVLHKYKQDIVFLDCDTFAMSDITPLFDMLKKSIFVMYAKGNQMMGTCLNDSFFSEYRAMVNIQNDKLVSKIISNPIDLCYYPSNSGVIGIPYKYVRILKDVAILCDQIYRACEIPVAEELAFSQTFQKHGDLFEAGDYIYHYYRSKYVLALLCRRYQIEAEIPIEGVNKETILNIIQQTKPECIDLKELDSYIYVMDSYITNENIFGLPFFSGEEKYLLVKNHEKKRMTRYYYQIQKAAKNKKNEVAL